MKTSRIYVTTSTYCTDNACSVSCQDVQRSSVGYSAGPAYHSARATSGASSIARTVARADAAFSRPHAKVDAEIAVGDALLLVSAAQIAQGPCNAAGRWNFPRESPRRRSLITLCSPVGKFIALFIRRLGIRHIGSSDQRCDLAGRY